MHRVATAFVLLLGCSESAPTPAPTPPPDPAPAATTDGDKPPAKADAGTCDDAPGWRYEPIALPPEFAPTLPAGNEILYFAPGMFKANSPEYWSYVFRLRFDQPGPTDTLGIKALLDDYYRGLIGAVAKSKREQGEAIEVDPKAIESTVGAAANSFEVTVTLVDAFVTGKPMTLTMDVRVSDDGRCMNAIASADGNRDAAVWRALEKARACVACP